MALTFSETKIDYLFSVLETSEMLEFMEYAAKAAPNSIIVFKGNMAILDRFPQLMADY